MDAAEMVRRVVERGRDARDRIKSETAEAVLQRRLKRARWFQEWLEGEVAEMDGEEAVVDMASGMGGGWRAATPLPRGRAAPILPAPPPRATPPAARPTPRVAGPRRAPLESPVSRPRRRRTGRRLSLARQSGRRRARPVTGRRRGVGRARRSRPGSSNPTPTVSQKAIWKGLVSARTNALRNPFALFEFVVDERACAPDGAVGEVDHQRDHRRRTALFLRPEIAGRMRPGRPAPAERNRRRRPSLRGRRGSQRPSRGARSPSR